MECNLCMLYSCLVIDVLLYTCIRVPKLYFSAVYKLCVVGSLGEVMRSSIYKPLRRCDAVTIAGERCSINSESNVRNRQGQLAADPLSRGCSRCRYHIELLDVKPVDIDAHDVILVYLDFETTGLRVLVDEIIEVGAITNRTQTCFATTVRPAQVPDTQEKTVHGISTIELFGSPDFKEVFLRFASFLNELVDNCIETSESDSSSEPTSGTELLSLKSPPPCILLAAHNGRKFDFPFLINEVLRCGISPFWMERWAYVDTLELTKVCALKFDISCAKLQCLGRNCSSSVHNRAHRALDDTRLLRDVVFDLAIRLGTSAENLLVPLAFTIDIEGTLRNLDFVA